MNRLLSNNASKLAKMLTIGVASSFLISDKELITKFLFSGMFGSSEKKSIKNTKSYIWGNGLYQVSKHGDSNYSNFEPKLIKNFNGKDFPNMSKIFFGKGFEASIDQKGNVHAWPMKPLHSSPRKDVSYNSRDRIVTVDKNGDNIQLGFTKRFLWVLKKNGTVCQYTVEPKDGNKNEAENVISTKKRNISSLKNIKQISCGNDHFVALDNDGNIYSMGDDTFGQCGLGSFNRVTGGPFYERRVRNPEKIPELPKIKKIVCGSNHTLAVSEAGDVYGWGNNSHLQLSHERDYSKVEDPLLAIYSPIKIDKNIKENEVIDVAAGENHSIYVTRNKGSGDTEVFASGFGLYGELGIGRTRHISDLEKIDNLSNFKIQTPEGEENIKIKNLECGLHHCMAFLNVGTVLEWGNNEFGQLGNNKRTFSTYPLVVGKFRKENVESISCGYNSSSVIVEVEDESSKTNKSK